jgi:hypothetical protein
MELELLNHLKKEFIYSHSQCLYQENVSESNGTLPSKTSKVIMEIVPLFYLVSCFRPVPF